MFNTSSIALIVGGSSGMGKATAERLLKAGVPVMILSHDKNNLAEAKQDLESVTKGQVEIAQVDLYDPSAVKSFIEQLNAEKRHIGYLVNA
ncbi:MAG: SDR family NAD(P)-dependent oxidoreductase, partial [Pseudomonadota bacterium]